MFNGGPKEGFENWPGIIVWGEGIAIRDIR
jgi:hypothetical protein